MCKKFCQPWYLRLTVIYFLVTVKPEQSASLVNNNSGSIYLNSSQVFVAVTIVPIKLGIYYEYLTKTCK